MSGVGSTLEGTGLEVLDIENDPAFAARRVHTHDVTEQMRGMQQLASAFVDHPDTILQELVNAAISLCGAESAGISLVKEHPSDAEYYEWVATAGMYSGFLNANLPRYPSACGVCLERGGPQLFRVSQRFFDLMEVDAPIVTDGILLPWQVDEVRGTIWIMAHQRTEAFDAEDCRLMQMLADFAAMAMRNQRQQKKLMEQAKTAAAAAMANQLAHQINNPLQSLTNVVYLAAVGQSGSDAKTLAMDLSGDVQRLSGLVKALLSLSTDTVPPK